MTQYRIKTSDGSVHTVTANTYVIDSSGLKLIGDENKTMALFTTFDWLQVVPAVVEQPATTVEQPADDSASTVETPVAAGQ